MQRVILPVTRYYGSKRKLANQIWDVLEAKNIPFESFLDVFGGSASMSYLAKAKQKMVFYNDIFLFNYYIGKALIEENLTELTREDIRLLLKKKKNHRYHNTIEKHFSDIYYTNAENKQIDIAVQNILMLDSENKKAGAFYILFQACLTKRPFNLFHRKNLNLRTNFTGGRFGNKVTWERPFEELFYKFHSELKHFTFDNKRENKALNFSALNCITTADLVYIDPPYFHEKNHVSYHNRYHFLEGIANYESFASFINFEKKHNEVLINKSIEFESKSNFLVDLRQLLSLHAQSTFAISYRSNGIPSINDIISLVSEFREQVQSVNLGNYSYALNRNNKENFEYLILGYS